MGERVVTYLDAAQAHDAARDRARKMVAVVQAFASGAGYRTADFLAATYGLADAGERGRFNAENAVDMSKWPSAAELEEALRTWHRAFLAMREAWELVPHHERTSVVSAPPKGMSFSR